MNFADRLDEAVERVHHPGLVGIDPHPDLLPDEYLVAREASAPKAERAAAVEAFCRSLVDLVAGRVAAIKPQSAFFELHGSAGVKAFENVVEHARSHGLLVIGDVKRGDIASTATAYASAFLESPVAACDAITVNPFLGIDSIEPFLEACKRSGAGVFVLVRTSNPGSSAFQLHGQPPLVEVLARNVERLGEPLRGSCGLSSVGAVVGATHSRELERLRSLMPHTPFLLPGYGAQGATAHDVAPAFTDRRHPWRGGLVNSSRGVAFAWKQPNFAGRSWKDAASAALDRMIGELRTVLEIRSP